MSHKHIRMKNWTVLRISSVLVIVIALIYLVINFSALSRGEGWGAVGMIGIMGIGLVGLGIDTIFKMIIVDRRWVNIFEAVLLVVLLGLLAWRSIYRSL